MYNPLTALKKWVISQLPTQTRTVYDNRQDQRSLASRMDVDRVHGIFDSAESGDPRDLFALYRDILLADSHISTELGKRKLAVLGDAMTVHPVDKKDAASVEVAKRVDAMLTGIPDRMKVFSHLMDSVLWPVSLLEKVFAVESGGYRVAALKIVPYELLDYTTGCLRLQATNPDTGLVSGQFFTSEASRYIIHRGHLLSTPDHWGGPMRSIVMWWLLGAMDRDWWSRFLDKYGSPFLLGRYNAEDKESRSVLERAFSFAQKLGGLVVTTDTQVEILQAGAGQTTESYERFLMICQREKSKLILGQTLSAEAQSTGLGSGVANQQEGVRQDIRQFDGFSLAVTLRDQLVKPWLEANGYFGPVPEIVFGSVSPAEMASTGKLLTDLKSAGLELTDEGIGIVSERFGLPLQRAAAPVSQLGMPALSLGARSLDRLPQGSMVSLSTIWERESAHEQIARVGSAELAQSFRGAFAPIRQLIALSRSEEELETSIRLFYADYDPARQARLIEDALAAYCANGTLLPDRS